ncbi:MAG: penicillin-binding protein 2, partial [Desulfuromonadales bacterium]|nr:penicillin-binding protein 2 [Desulfuromonadales bacterium]
MNVMTIRSRWVDLPRLKSRFTLLILMVLAIFTVLLLRLWFLQIISAERYQLLSEKNRVRYVPVAAERGPIYDRHGELLVDNRPGFTIAALRQEVDDSQTMIRQLAEYLSVNEETLKQNWSKGKSLPHYRPVPLAVNVDREAIERIQENAIDLPGVLTLVTPVRAYPNGELGAHLFGYLGEITEEELRSSNFNNHSGGDFVGKSGIERYLEKYLQGQEGSRLLEVDVKGKGLRTLKIQEPKPGLKVFLTLDRKIQQAAEAAFGDQAGAAVAIDVRTGAILAMTSKPSFDPAFFARGISGDEWLALLKNSRHPLTNKALKGQYPPGSTFKLVTALAALRSGLIMPEFEVDCRGKIELGNREFRCWKKRGHGKTDLKKALRESCDVWFYEVGQKIGIDTIAKMSRELGLDSVGGYRPDSERSGLIPDTAWKKQRFNERWYDGESIIAAIGQGFVLTTPMQLAVMTAAIANGGKVMRPYLVDRVETFDGEIVLQQSVERLGTAQLTEDQLAPVRAGLEAVVNEPHGTGWASRLPGITVAGKTGTSQVIRLKADDEVGVDDAEIKYQHRDHALFVSYAPAKNPEIAVAVIVEHGSHGSSVAGPISREILGAYFGIDMVELKEKEWQWAVAARKKAAQEKAELEA